MDTEGVKRARRENGEEKGRCKDDERKGIVWDTQEGGDVYDHDITRRMLSVFAFAICVSTSDLTVNRAVMPVFKRGAWLSDYDLLTKLRHIPIRHQEKAGDGMRGDGVQFLALVSI